MPIKKNEGLHQNGGLISPKSLHGYPWNSEVWGESVWTHSVGTKTMNSFEISPGVLWGSRSPCELFGSNSTFRDGWMLVPILYPHLPDLPWDLRFRQKKQSPTDSPQPRHIRILRPKQRPKLSHAKQGHCGGEDQPRNETWAGLVFGRLGAIYQQQQDLTWFQSHTLKGVIEAKTRWNSVGSTKTVMNQDTPLQHTTLLLHRVIVRFTFQPQWIVPLSRC